MEKKEGTGDFRKREASSFHFSVDEPWGVKGKTRLIHFI